MRKITEDLFTFPIVMVDGENEERKERENDILGSRQEPDEVEYDIVYGEASYPYYHFVGFEDRWLPTQRSLARALKQKFDACIVRFDNIGQFLVPMSKDKFAEQLELFAETRPPRVPQVLDITPAIAEHFAKKNEEKD